MTALQHNFIAVDLGATSGRTILGTISDGKIEMEVLTRFKHYIHHVSGHYYWDIYHLYNEILNGLKQAASRNVPISSIGIDTWGVDVVMVGKDGQLLRTPYSYRDPHTEGAMDKYFKLVPKERVYELCGIQFMNFNTLFQLSTMHENQDPALAIADKILFLPDALSYMLTGNTVTERTILSTSSFMDANTGEVCEELLNPIGIKKEQFAPVVQPGHVIGTLTDEIQKETGLGAIPVIAVAGHDTASAVAAVPAVDEGFAYLSSGTWSLMGIETKKPVISPTSYEMNFTNEGGLENTTRLLKNICGMWILECCRKEWKGAPDSYDKLYEETEKTEAFRSFIFPDSPEFANPKSMVQAIQDYCKRTNQPIPVTYQEQARCIFDSLAMRYRQVFEMLKQLSSFEINRLHIIGGGTHNFLLNQYTANSLNVPVYTGPDEATAIGNIMVQAKGANLVGNLQEMRQIISQSIAPQCYLPAQADEWNEAYDKYLKITN